MYNYLYTRLQQKWNVEGDWKLVDLINDYFVVKFEIDEDLNFVFTSGPWIIAGQYLAMQKQRPGFCPATAHITHMVAQITVTAIQLECFDVWSLQRIGNLLGKLLKIDTLTTARNRGKFARLCVELDLTKLLDAFIQINDIWYNIEYEGLLDIYDLCGKYGHKWENCELKAKIVDNSIGETSNEAKAMISKCDITTQAVDINMVKDGLRRPWMNVQPRRKPKTSGRDLNGRDHGTISKCTQFNALTQVNDDFERNDRIFELSSYQPSHKQVLLLIRVLSWVQKCVTKSKSKTALML